jgi:hypothetical protein
MGLTLNVEILGLPKVSAYMRQWGDSALLAFAAGIFLGASEVITTAMRITPVDTGYLRSSRYVTKPVITGRRVEVRAGFHASYATRVHETNRQYVVGEWKFLSKAVDYHVPTFGQTIGSVMMRLLRNARTLDASTFSGVHPTDPTPNPAAEKAAAIRRRNKSKRTIAKRAFARDLNQRRIAHESAAALRAQRQGKRPKPPGRG